ncbi:MAG: hypothetical protein GY798_22965 [Hyphomicrobiales bacterium]|nr:hypothetical protein [Hyphomicrobiales bacterium]
MEGIIVRYRYDGDDAPWRSTINRFIDAINADEAVKGRFRYSVTIAKDGVGRTHIGRWDSDETLKTVQSRDYFKQFSEAVQEFAGDTLEPGRMEVVASTD